MVVSGEWWLEISSEECAHHRTTDRTVSGGHDVPFPVCFVDQGRDRVCQSHSPDIDGHGCQVDHPLS